MGRIRSIKPDFPQSENVGKLSREGRLLFIQLFTLVDDEGRARASSRMLASLLYPYDDDAPKLIDGWMIELERANMVRRYDVDGSTYLEIVKWLDHQKIDKPSKSRLPAFVEGSRRLASPREELATDMDMEEDKEEDISRSVVDRPARKRLLKEHPRFAEFWQECPRRDGANPRKTACSRFSSLVKTGVDPQFLIDEAVRWRKGEEGRGKIGTQFVARVITWLNEDRWSDHAAVFALQALAPTEFTIEDAVKQWARFRRWPRGPNFGSEPGLSGCLASDELLAKHGIAPDGRKMPPREAA